MSTDSLWLFGYGSLVWRPDFRFRRRQPGTIEGYRRRFWQGSTDHRGVPGRPGRVVTLLPEGEAGSRPGGVERGGQWGPRAREARACWGMAYEVVPEDRDAVLEQLDYRERGGYTRLEIEMVLYSQGTRAERVEGLVYVAGPANDNYLGPASISEIARQIAGARGPSGANPEYVFELARRLRAMGAVDEHVFAVERAVSAHLEGRRT